MKVNGFDGRERSINFLNITSMATTPATNLNFIKKQKKSCAKSFRMIVYMRKFHFPAQTKGLQASFEQISLFRIKT